MEALTLVTEKVLPFTGMFEQVGICPGKCGHRRTKLVPRLGRSGKRWVRRVSRRDRSRSRKMGTVAG